MSNTCGTCNKSASSRDLIRCFGKCQTAFHPICIDPRMDSWIKTFRECTFAKFVCLGCQNSTLFDASAEFSGLNEQISQVSQSVNLLAEKFEASFDKFNTEASRIMMQFNSNSASIPPHTTPSSIINLHNAASGTSRAFINPSDCIIGSCSAVDESIKAAVFKDRKFVYASKFNTATTVEDLRKFLGQKLSVPENELECRLLVSANQDVTRLNFVSFKIGVDPGLFDKLLLPDSWPSGILVREFIARPKNSRQF